MVLLLPIFLTYSLLLFPCEPSFHLSSMGGKSFFFFVLAPKLSDSLPLALRTTTTLHEFKSKLKSHLFKQYYQS